MSDDDTSNLSGNRPFHDILKTRLSRREIIKGGLGLASASFFASPVATLAASTDKSQQTPLINFTPVPKSEGRGPTPAISKDYQFDIIIPWGESLQPGGPDFHYPPSAEDQAKQIGIGHDGMHFFPLKAGKFGRGGNTHGMLAINHEFGRNTHVLGKKLPESLAEVRSSQLAHGMSVVELKKTKGRWHTVKSDRARRIHVNTPVTFSGPAAGHALLKTKKGNQPQGTVNNCASGFTPWGTYLTCEENFNTVFGSTKKLAPSHKQARYGLSPSANKYGWERFDPRFDLANADYHNEENRFGWIVEVDPMNAAQTPIKRTALGRFKHEGIAITVGQDGRIVGYMGDDQMFDYIYKFVSNEHWQTMRAKGQSPLDHGTLYVAKFNDDGSGEWLALSIHNPVLAQSFSSQAELLIYARIAADKLGATPMDRPEWTSVAPNGDVYCTLTNNKKRTQSNQANPMAPNPDGHIIRWRDTENHIGTAFSWEIFLIAADSHASEDTYSDPDGLWADPDGRLFIQTDGKQQDGLNNQLLVADTTTGELRRLLTGVAGAEITGITTTPDRRTLFVNIQHPGKGKPKLSNFPAKTDGITVPRDATMVITRKDGGIVGS